MNKIIKCINIKNLAKILVIALLISTCSVVVPVSVSAEDMGTQVDTTYPRHLSAENQVY